MAEIIALLIALGIIFSPEEATDDIIQGFLDDDVEQM